MDYGARGGSFVLDGETVEKVSTHGLAQKGVAYVPQGREIFPVLTIKENLEAGFACLPRPQRVVWGKIFELFPILHQFLARRGGDLSGGPQQQLVIARALVIKPRLLLLDEPTENTITQISQVIKTLRSKGDMAIVLVEQFFDFACDLGDEFLVLERGVRSYGGRADAVERGKLLASVAVTA